MLTEKLVQYHSLLGHSQGCLSTEEVRVLLFCAFSLLGQAQLPYIIGGTRELPPYWIIPGFIVNT